jgi:4-amino-4-deoxy-L-arabinose transferase-like glycosyltransferase
MPRFPAITPAAAVAFVLLILTGIALRVSFSEPFKGVGFDEGYYARYVDQVSRQGWWNYPALVQGYLNEQKDSANGLPTPTRVTLVLGASAWHLVFGTTALESVRAVSCTASILTLLAATVFVWRVRTVGFALAFLALFTFSPTQLYMAHRALADSFMCLVVLIALWSLWEILARSPRLWIWRMVFGLSLVLIVLTKENAAFPYLGIVALVAAVRWFKFGRVDTPLVLVTVLAPLLGVLVICLCAGGWSTLVDVYTLDVAKTYGTPYALAAEDGPWFRYIVDHLLANPVVVLLAIGGALYLTAEEKPGLYLFGFVAVTYLPMCNVPHGMNLRYATIWDVPLTYLALLPIFRWAQWPGVELFRRVLLIVLVSAVALTEIQNYVAIFVDNAIYDPVTSYLMQALKMISARPQ